MGWVKGGLRSGGGSGEIIASRFNLTYGGMEWWRRLGTFVVVRAGMGVGFVICGVSLLC